MAALRQRSFLYYCCSRVCSGTGSAALTAAILWQVWSLYHNTLYLGMIGLVRFLPALLLSLPAGAFADSFDRRRVIVLHLLAERGGGNAGQQDDLQN